MHRDLRRKGVTLALVWEEYKAVHPQGMQYRWYCRQHRARAAKVDVVMRQEHTDAVPARSCSSITPGTRSVWSTATPGSFARRRSSSRRWGVELHLRLRQLCLDHRLHGKRLHDANVVATMLTHELRILVTQNAADFSPFDEVEVIDVDEAAAHR